MNKNFDWVGHPECSHNWIHYARKQCEMDVPNMSEIVNGKIRKKDSNNICNFYICTLCQGEFWSSEKVFDIPHYRVREGENKK